MASDGVEDIEIQLLLEALYRRYHYDFRSYSQASLVRRVRRALAEHRLRRVLIQIAARAPGGILGDGGELKKFIKSGDWNDLEVIARGNTIIQLINGHVMSALIDDDKANRKMDGEIGIQLHVTKAAMKIETRNIRIKTF